MVKFLEMLYRIMPIKPVYLRGKILSVIHKFRLLGKNRIVIKKIRDIYYELHLNQIIDSSLYYNGYFERDSTDAIRRIVKPGMTVVDIGANIGCHALPMALLVGSAGKVIAFEPMTWAYTKLLKNISLNEFTNIVVEKKALSNTKEQRELHFKTSWRIDGSEKEDKEVESIELLTLDEYLYAKDISVDFIKIDVDGYELKIIEGAIKTLRKNKPVLLLELGVHTLRQVDHSLSDLIDCLFSNDYKCYKESDEVLLNGIEDILVEIGDLESRTINAIFR